MGGAADCPKWNRHAPGRPALPLIKAVARVHRWPERIMRGEFQSRHSIAQFAQVDQRYAGRILQFAFLAPDIVEAILEGRQRADLTVQKYCAVCRSIGPNSESG